MCSKLGWKRRFPYSVTVPGDPLVINQWLSNKFGNDYLTLSSGKQLKITRKEGVWAYDQSNYNGATYRFCNEKYITMMILTWT